MDLDLYLHPASVDPQSFQPHTLGERTGFHNKDGIPDLKGAQVAILGVPDDPGHKEPRGCVQATQTIRDHLYTLFAPPGQLKVVDLGNILPGNSHADTIHALAETIADLIGQNILPLIIGGGQGLTYAQYLAYEKLERTANLACVDPRFDLGNAGDELSESCYLGHIVLRQPNYLFNFSNLGFQTYLVDRPGIELMDKLYFDVHRLGEVRGSMSEAEPVMRNADTLSIDMSAVRRSDAPGTSIPRPNGFHAEEICQIMRYAGISEKITSIGIYEMDPTRDQHGVTAQLVAEMIWCFLDGFVARTNDLPWLDRRRFTKFKVHVKEHEQELVFFKSELSDRWWMDVPYKADHEARFERHHLVPCSYEDYQRACKEEVPDRWWRTFQKLI